MRFYPGKVTDSISESRLCIVFVKSCVPREKNEISNKLIVCKYIPHADNPFRNNNNMTHWDINVLASLVRSVVFFSHQNSNKLSVKAIFDSYFIFFRHRRQKSGCLLLLFFSVFIDCLCFARSHKFEAIRDAFWAKQR